MDNTIDRLSQAYRDGGFTPIVDPKLVQVLQRPTATVHVWDTHTALFLTSAGVICVFIATICFFPTLFGITDHAARLQEQEIQIRKSVESFREAEQRRQMTEDELREKLDFYDKALTERVKRQTASNRK